MLAFGGVSTTLHKKVLNLRGRWQRGLRGQESSNGFVIVKLGKNRKETICRADELVNR